MTKLTVPLKLETAGGDSTISIQSGTCSVAASFVTAVCSTPCSPSVFFSTVRGEKDGYLFVRCPEGSGVLKGPKNVKLERAGGRDYLVGENDVFCLPCAHLARLMEVTVA